MTDANVSTLFDSRIDCVSAMTELPLSAYLELIMETYEGGGRLQNQRSGLKTTTARRIRERMLRDILAGTVLPPIVIGAVVSAEDFQGLKSGEITDAARLLSEKYKSTLSIIDGMQRTTALIDAAEEGGEAIAGRRVRIEIWAAKKVNSLIYRMLVLNTGQVPWDIGRQIQVVYAPLIEELKDRVSFTRVLDKANKRERRFNAGEFSTSTLAESYIAFGLK